MNPFDIFARASANQPLTPQERGFLKLAQGAGWAAVLAALGVLTPLLTSGRFEFNQATILAVSVAFVVALLNAIAKVVSANGDAGSVAVGAVISAAAQDVQQSNAPQAATPAALMTAPAVASPPLPVAGLTLPDGSIVTAFTAPNTSSASAAIGGPANDAKQPS
ncbi:MAG TPA: hypothetical protein VMV29_10010 [Ktedonobacterales bacterium]|nr:hypothetical protein [Ktedonobacterales bacterium]